MKCFAPFNSEQMRSYQCFINTSTRSISRRSSRSFSFSFFESKQFVGQACFQLQFFLASSARSHSSYTSLHEDCAMMFRSFATLWTIDLQRRRDHQCLSKFYGTRWWITGRHLLPLLKIQVNCDNSVKYARILVARVPIATTSRGGSSCATAVRSSSFVASSVHCVKVV